MSRYFKSTLSDLVWKFGPEGSFTRILGCGTQWMPCTMTISAMDLCATEITAEEGEEA